MEPNGAKLSRPIESYPLRFSALLGILGALCGD